MAEPKLFKGFFSYAHDDAKTDPRLISELTTELERRVNAKLIAARFAIWCDKEQLRTGHRWDPRIEAELRDANVLIVLLTPRWIDSDYCRKEYAVFEETEPSVGEYVAPILARPIEPQEKHFTTEQREIYSRIRHRQFFHAIATDFLKLSPARRNAEIEKIADDIAV